MVRNLWSIIWPIIVFIAPWLLVGALVGSYPGYKLYQYVWNDAAFCTSCHVHDYASVGWKKSIHGQLTTCHDCHHQPLVDYARETILLVTKQPKFPKDLHHTPHVAADLCEACHMTEPEQTSSLAGPLSSQKAELKRLPKVDQLYLHALHLRMETRMPLPKMFPLGQEKNFGTFEPQKDESGAEGHREAKTSTKRNVTCMDCHGGPANRAHDFSVADRSCVRCHASTHRTELVKNFGCRNCHYQDFLTPISATMEQSKAAEKAK